ncbi:NAD(P)-binding protein [Pigmentibacter ruber]
MSINRRDFINGSAIAILAGLSPLEILGKESCQSNYPPKLTGLRGSHIGSFENAHALVSGEKFEIDTLQSEEYYDLVVVGAGISGLTAAYYYLKKNSKAKILILDNHDDFGGHAKRNEFKQNKNFILGYGGTESFQSPKHYFQKELNTFLLELGINIDNLGKKFDQEFYKNLGLDFSIFFDKETFGEDKFVLGDPLGSADVTKNSESIADIIANFPLNEKEKISLLNLLTIKKDYLPDLKTVDEKVEYLKKTSYRDFLLKNVKLSEKIVNIFQQKSHDYLAIGIDGINSYLDARSLSLPGLDGMNLPPLDPDTQAEVDEPYIYHFPDGGATIARLLVTKLLPKVFLQKSDMNSIIQTKLNYSYLDLPNSQVRIRLNSTVVIAKNENNNTVSLGYLEKPILDPQGKFIKHGKLHKISAKHSIMAGYNMMIPFIVPELPSIQKEVLLSNVKAPLIYTNVLLSNWRSFQKLKTHCIYNPALNYALIKLDFPVNIGHYSHPKNPDKPILLHMVSIPKNNKLGADARTQFKASRFKLYSTPFSELEHEIRTELQRILGPTGEFEHEKDILEITVNRWPHGYSYSFNPLFDDESKVEELISLAKKPCKNITIANCDSGWNALTHVAIAEAIRAVNELNFS